MELFSLLAKLSLDKKEYEREIRKLENQDIEINDPSIGLNTSQFDSEIAAIPDTDVEDIDDEPEVTLDRDDFDSEIDAIPDTEVDDISDEPELGLNDEPFKQGLEDAESDTSSFSGTVKDIFDELGGFLAQAAVVGVVAGIVSSLSEAVDLARSLGDNIDKQSRAMSISTDAYQEWSHVLDINGASITDLNRGLMNMRKLMGGGDVSKEASEAFEKLGLSAKVANGEITTTEDLLKASLKALADFSGSAAERDVLAQAIFGRGGTKLNALFDGTSQDIDDLIQQAHELGLVMSEESVANAASYNDAVTNMKASIEAFRVSLVEGVLPILTDVANTIAKIVAFLNPRTGQKSLSEMYAEDDAKFAEELLTIEATSTAAETLADKLLAMGDTSKMTAEQYEIWKGTAEALIELVPSLGEVIDTETGQISANSEEIKENIKQWENLAKQKALQALKEEKYQEIVGKNKDYIEQSVKANKAEANAVAEKEKAIDALNEVLKENGAIGENGEGLLTYDSTITDVANARNLLNVYSQAYTKFGNIMSEWTSANREAIEAREKANELNEEVEKGKQEYKEWVATAEEMYGSASESEEQATEDAKKFGEALMEIPDSKTVTVSFIGEPYDWNPHHHASGAWDIPYDNYPALLHRDETVLSASQARKYREGEGGSVDYDSITEIVAVAVAETMSKVNVLMSGEKVADLTTRRVKNNINASSNSRLRSMGG